MEQGSIAEYLGVKARFWNLVFVCMIGFFWNVQMVGEEVTGPPTKMDWAARGDKEKYLKDPACHTTLWECSEVATGVAL